MMAIAASFELNLDLDDDASHVGVGCCHIS